MNTKYTIGRINTLDSPESVLPNILSTITEQHKALVLLASINAQLIDDLKEVNNKLNKHLSVVYSYIPK